MRAPVRARKLTSAIEGVILVPIWPSRSLTFEAVGMVDDQAYADALVRFAARHQVSSAFA